MLNHCPREDAIRVAEDLRKNIEFLKPNDLTVTASFGVAELHADETDFSTLFSRADSAVYEAKESGRNKVVFKNS